MGRYPRLGDANAKRMVFETVEREEGGEALRQVSTICQGWATCMGFDVS